MNAALIGSVVGTAAVVAIVLLSVIVLCVYCRYHRTAKMSLKKTDQ